MNKQCEQIQELLTAYALGDLSEAKAADVRAHLDTCGDCQAALRQIGPTLDVLRDALAAPSSAPARLSDERRRRIFAARPAPVQKVTRWFTVKHPVLDLAALLVIGLVFVALLMPAMQSARMKASAISSDGEHRSHLKLGFDAKGNRRAEVLQEEKPSASLEDATIVGYTKVSPGAQSALRQPDDGERDEKRISDDSGLSGNGEVSAAVHKNMLSGEAVALLDEESRRRRPGEGNGRDQFGLAGAAPREPVATIVNGAFAEASAPRLDDIRPAEPPPPAAAAPVVSDESDSLVPLKREAGGSAAKAKEEMVPLKIKLPKPMYVGTPVPISVRNLEKPQPSAAPAAKNEVKEDVTRVAGSDASRFRLGENEQAAIASSVNAGRVVTAGGRVDLAEKTASTAKSGPASGQHFGYDDREQVTEDYAKQGVADGVAGPGVSSQPETLGRLEAAVPEKSAKDLADKKNNLWFMQRKGRENSPARAAESLAERPTTPAPPAVDTDDDGLGPETERSHGVAEGLAAGVSGPGGSAAGNMPLSPQPAAFDSVAYVKSPVLFKGIYASRTPGARGSAVGRYGSGGAGGGGTELSSYRSLRWMKEKQGEDGTWNGKVEDTSVSLLAYLAHGETPASAEFGATTEKAIKALIDAQRPDGRFSDDPEVNDKAAYALNETYAMTKVPMVREAAEKATKAVVADQAKLKKLAGWHVSALKSAKMAGIGNGTLDQAMKEASEKLKAEDGPAAVLGLQLLGHANEAATREKLQALQKSTFELKAEKMDDMFFTTQAKFHGGATTFTPWNREFAPKLMKEQTVVKSSSSGKDLGFWPLPGEGGRQKGDVYNTAIASLMETVYYRHLPTYTPPEPEESTLAALSEKDEIKVIVEDKAVKEPEPDNMTGPRFKATGVNPIVTTLNQPFSTFSIDVDTASYTLSRNYMLKGQLPPAEAVRTEEFVNFFDYDYKPPVNKTFGVYIESAPSKFGHGQQLLKIGVKGRRLGREEQRGAVLTILVDTSGSMNTPDRIELAKKALRMLVERLGPKDTVALVQFDNHARVVLSPTKAAERKAILAAIDGMQCNGSTNLEEGMRRAYEVAGANFAPGSENRVLLLSDGAANLGTASAADMLRAVEKFRKQGIFCSVFGMGQGTYNDEMLGTLADKGDGVYRFIDSEQEARQVFVDDLAATLNTIARDVKIQVEFNPAAVKSYRQLGYEKRQLKTEDFRNDAVDAGEVGSGQSVTALYELDLAPQAQPGQDIVCTVRVRYMRTDVKKIEEIEERFRLSQIGRSFDGMDARFRLAACAAETAEILRGSPFAAGSEWNDVAAVLRPVALELSLDSRVAELLRLVQGAKDMARGE